jgi:hypothetical protein
MGDQGVVPPGGMTEYLDGLLHPPTAGPAPVRDLSSILLDPTQHFQLDLDQAPKAIAAFRQAAEGLRDLMDETHRLGQVRPPGIDAVSINAAIGGLPAGQARCRRLWSPEQCRWRRWPTHLSSH